MKNRSILLGCLGAMLCITSMAQTTEDFPKKQKPWSVRMAESEMVRNPESWQVDFQPSLKWDYCHGLELGAMMIDMAIRNFMIMRWRMQIQW